MIPSMGAPARLSAWIIADAVDGGGGKLAVGDAAVGVAVGVGFVPAPGLEEPLPHPASSAATIAMALVICPSFTTRDGTDAVAERQESPPSPSTVSEQQPRA